MLLPIDPEVLKKFWQTHHLRRTARGGCAPEPCQKSAVSSASSSRRWGKNYHVDFVRISSVTPLKGFRLRLALTNGAIVERDVEPLLTGPVFEAVRENPQVFRAATVDAGTVMWPNGADLCPDLLIWGGPPREGSPPDTLVLAARTR
jgi:hypothetical protein